MKKYIKVKCNFCGKIFERYKSKVANNNYCGHRCSNLSQKSGKEVKCGWCSKIFYATNLQIKKSKSKKVFCSRSCSNSHRNTLYKGKNHPNYKYGKSSYRHIALEKKGARCEICGYKKCLSALEVHHLNENRNDNSYDNLKILCRNCHAEIHFKNKINKI